MTDIVVVR